MNILLALFKYFPQGGLQKDTLRFAQEAARRGHNVTIFCSSWQGDKPEGINVLAQPIHAWTNYGAMECFRKAVADYLQTHDVDVSLAMNRIPGCDAYFVADSCMGKWMRSQHSPLVLACHPRYRTYLRHEESLCSPNAHTKLFYIAESQHREYAQWYSLPEERFVYLPPGMDERCRLQENDDVRRRKRAQLGLGDGTLAFFLAGTNLLRKGVDRVLATVKALPENLDVRFFLAGKENPTKVRRMVQKLGVPDERFCFLGARDDVPDLMQAMDLMIHPAREEGTGTVLIEAIASGLPVVCSQACGFENFVREATGTVVPEPFSQETLNQMVLHAINELPALKQSTREYAKHQDFTGRSRVAVDELEKIARSKLVSHSSAGSQPPDNARN